MWTLKIKLISIKQNLIVSETNQTHIKIRFDKRIHLILIFRLDPAQHEFVLS